MTTRRSWFAKALCAIAWVLGVSLGLVLSADAQSPDQQIPAVRAFDPPACSDVELGGIRADFGFGIVTVPSPYRTDPEWKAIILDPALAPHRQPPTILEGFVSPQPSDQTAESQSTAEVAEEDISWTHYTHDFTFKVIPDPEYFHLLASWARGGQTIINPGWTDEMFAAFCAQFPTGLYNGVDCFIPAENCSTDNTGRTCLHTDMEVEWDNASLMDEKEGFQRDWGAVPEFVWPAVGDRVWVMGRWIFDCGHPSSESKDGVKFSTEIHPPRALVTYRLNHVALDSFPQPRVSAPNFPAPQSFLPVTGEPVILPPDAPNSGPTNVPVTEADIFVSGNGGPANDVCSLVPYPCSAFGGHSGPIIPINDRNYVFDIYPPGADYLGFARPRVNGTFGVARPVPDASLQWRIVDHSSELPAHTCGDSRIRPCITVDPIVCLLDSSTPPPDQSETSCPPVPPNPTRLRVILPFAGSNVTYFAKSILLGWDDVPTPANSTASVRTFKVRLHRFTINENGKGCCTGADWRLFLNVGGQWRYMSSLFDTDANSGAGIYQFDQGNNRCNGDALTNNGDGDCFQFDNTPFTVSVQDGTPIHVAVGGFIARGVEDSGSSLFPCRSYPGDCDSPSSFLPINRPFIDLPFENDDRIGTYEFDLIAPDYAAPAAFQIPLFDCSISIAVTGCDIQYQVEFTVNEVPRATPPVSGPLVLGNPSFNGPGGTFVSSTTPLTLSATSADIQGFQYRFRQRGGPLPTYTTDPFPIHWTNARFFLSSGGVPASTMTLYGSNLDDGSYDFQYSANTFANLLEPRHTTTLSIDNTAPVATITQPASLQYVHSATLKLDYAVSDGTGSGVNSVVPRMDGAPSLPDGTALANGQTVNLLTQLSLGSHVFSVDSSDNLNNAGTNSVTFEIIVTADSIKDDVRQFLQSKAIGNAGSAISLLAKLNLAAIAQAHGRCSLARNLYQAFIKELQSQSGKQVDAAAAAIMIADAQYLIEHCP
jgi:hypothetical protein